MKPGLRIAPVTEAEAPALQHAAVPAVRRRFDWDRHSWPFVAYDGGLMVGAGCLEENLVWLWVKPGLEGRGYGTGLLRALVKLGFRRKLRKISARIDPANRAARRVVKKCGFKYEGCLRKEKRLNGRWVDQECWGLLREEA